MDVDMLTTLPNEVLHHIFKDVEVMDIARLTRTCRKLHAFTIHNVALFRDMFLQRLDGSIFDTRNWEEELHLLVKMERILAYKTHAEKVSCLPQLTEMVDHFLKIAAVDKPSKTRIHLAEIFASAEDKIAFLLQSEIYRRLRADTEHRRDPEHTPHPRSLRSESGEKFRQRQASAKLHVLYGGPSADPEYSWSSQDKAYEYACSVVYDLRNYTLGPIGTKWGPFLPNGKAMADWEKIEAILIVINYNIRAYLDDDHRPYIEKLWRTAFEGVTPGSFKSIPQGLSEPQKPQPLDHADPYNITGTYIRIICFLDFHELHHYNFTSQSSQTISNNEPRPPLATQEAIRILHMELKVTAIKYPGDEGYRGAGSAPAVYFEGVSGSASRHDMEGGHSRTRGCVRMTEEGELRWTTFSVYWGEERWKSEGIQVGGVNSGRGVFGSWFDKHHSREGPAGPSVFWKISDEINPKSKALFPGDESDDSEGDDYIPVLFA
ncbi:hypothetical protein B0O99DRAFT_616829 [Bisporella sp. PMI_857]|nr:hypothetical protein B0O99DRAFT_616829 [Bisporella sp. PMI_857]